MRLDFDKSKRLLRRNYIFVATSLVLIVLLGVILLSISGRFSSEDSTEDFISYPSHISNPISQPEYIINNDDIIVLKERFSQFPFEFSGRDYLISIPTIDDLIIQKNDEDSSVVVSGPSYNFVLKVNNEAQLGIYTEDPTPILIEDTNINSNFYRIFSNTSTYDLGDSLNQKYGLNNSVWSFYTTEYLEKDECNQIVQTPEEYYSCDMGVLKIENAGKKGFMNMYCGVNDEEQVEKCDEIVKNLSIILK